MFVAMLAAVTGWLLVDPSLAFAQSAPGASPVAQCSDYAGLTSRIVTCIRDTLTNVTGDYFDGFYRIVQMAIAGFMTAGVAIYGTLAAMGMLEKIGRDTVVLAVKLSMVTFFITNTNYVYNEAISAMDGLAAAVVQYTPESNSSVLGAQRAQCVEQMKSASDEAGVPYSPVWLGMDCLLDSVVGIKVATTWSNQNIQNSASEWYNTKLEGTGMGRSLIFLFFSGLQTSVVGIIFAVIGFIFLYSLVFMIGKAMFTYLAGYIGIAFMMIFAPIFIPLVLFRKTKEYFDKWLKLTISFALQPVLILVFVIFSMAAVDLAAFSGDYSLMYRVAGEASRQPNFNLNKYLTDAGAISKKSSEAYQNKVGVGDQSTVIQNGEKIKELLQGLPRSECLKRAQNLDPETKKICEQNWSVSFWHDSIDWKKLAEARNPPVVLSGDATRPEQQISREVLASSILCAIVVFVMLNLLKVVPLIVNDLLGDSFASPNLYGAVSKRGFSFDRLAGSIGDGLKNTFRGG